MKKILALACICVLLVSAVPAITREKHNHLFFSENNLELSATDSYDLLVIAPNNWKEDLQPLKQHKESHGIQTIVVGLNEIYSGTYFPINGRDAAEKIKYFLKSALDEWNITFVLIVGGRKYGIEENWYTPVRYVTVSSWGWSATYLSDLYFADIYDDKGNFSTWDTDNDNVFGTQKDDMDLHPDVYVGRWACRNKIEVKTMVEKTINYESKPENAKKIVLIGGDTFEDPGTDYDEGELITTESANCLPGYEPIKVYSSEGTVSAREIREALGDGASFMHFKGHGWVIYWNTYKHDKTESEPGFGIWDIPFFLNEKYPIVVFGGCHTAMFNVSVTNRPHVWNPYYDLPKILIFFPAVESISWFFNRKIGGGSIASLGYTCISLSGVGERGDLDHDGITEPDCIEWGSGFMEINFFYAHGIEELTYLGECWGYAENTYINTLGTSIRDLINIQGFVLLGDPSLKIGGYS